MGSGLYLRVQCTVTIQWCGHVSVERGTGGSNKWRVGGSTLFNAGKEKGSARNDERMKESLSNRGSEQEVGNRDGERKTLGNSGHM